MRPIGFPVRSPLSAIVPDNLSAGILSSLLGGGGGPGPAPSFVPLEHFVVFGASIENRMFDTAPERQPVIDRVQQLTGTTVKIYEMADEGATTADLYGNIDNKITTLKGGTTLLPANKTVKCLVHIGGNNVTSNRPYTSAQDGTVITDMLTQINYILDRIEAAGWEWVLTTLSFRDYANECWANESLGSDPYNQKVINIINAARGKYVYSDGISWADYYTWWYNNNVSWLEYDGVHPTAACVAEGDLFVANQVVAPLVTGVAATRIAKVAYQARPNATIAVLNSPAAEDGALQYRITLSASVFWNTRLTLLYTGTAVAGTDYTAGPTELVIPAGQTIGNFSIQGLADASADGDKTLIVTINTTGDGYVRASPFAATGTYTDGAVAPAVPAVSIAGGQSVAEGSSLAYTVTASSAPAADIVIGLAYSGTTATDDYSGPASVTIAAGQTTATVTVTTADDASSESAETVIVTLQTGTGYTVGTASATGTINASDQPASGPMDVGKKIIFNLGSDTKPAASGANTVARDNRNDAVGIVYVSSALNTAGEATGVALSLGARATGSNSFGTNPNGVQNRSYAEITSGMLHSSWFGNGNATPAQLLIGGLPAGTYRVLVGATREDTSTTTVLRVTTLAITVGSGTGGTYDTASAKTAGTENWHFSTTATPNGSGVIGLSFSNASGSGNYWYVAAIVLERLS